MKKYFFRTLIVFFVVSMWFAAKAQQRKYLQVGLFGAASSPSGTYKNPIGEAGLGYVTGASADYYFINGDFGIGLDARFIHHPHNGTDTVTTSTRPMEFLYNTYHTPPRFRHISIAIGPTYQYLNGKFGIELFVKGGVMAQIFPQYTRRWTYYNTDDPQSVTVRHSDFLRAGNLRRSNAWTMLAGLRINYKIQQRLGLFVTGDYQTTLGDSFFGRESRFSIDPIEGAERPPIRQIERQTTNIKMFNVGAGIRFLFGNDRNPDLLQVVP